MMRDPVPSGDPAPSGATSMNGIQGALKPIISNIRDDFQIVNQVLGAGASGNVYVCYHRATNVKHALKILKDSPRSRNEVDIHWRLSLHPNIVSIKAVYENNYKGKPHLFVVMECMDGDELLKRIQDEKNFTEADTARLFRKIVCAVRYLHQMDIAHRDLKPENLLFVSPEKDSDIKLTDFGFAKHQSLGLQTPCYTPYYVAPEVLQNERMGRTTYGRACDVWSLGVILYILLCGYPPFYTEHGGNISPGMRRRIRLGEFYFPVEEWGDISSEVKGLIQNMLRVTASERFTIEEIAQHPWVSGKVEVPGTPLRTATRLGQEGDIRHAVLTQMEQMRKGADVVMEGEDGNGVTMMSLDKAGGALLGRRGRK